MLARMGHDSCSVRSHIDELIFPNLEKWAPSSTTPMPCDAKPSTENSPSTHTHTPNVCGNGYCLGFLRACVFGGKRGHERSALGAVCRRRGESAQRNLRERCLVG